MMKLLLANQRKKLQRKKHLKNHQRKHQLRKQQQKLKQKLIKLIKEMIQHLKSDPEHLVPKKMILLQKQHLKDLKVF